MSDNKNFIILYIFIFSFSFFANVKLKIMEEFFKKLEIITPGDEGCIFYIYIGILSRFKGGWRGLKNVLNYKKELKNGLI